MSVYSMVGWYLVYMILVRMYLWQFIRNDYCCCVQVDETRKPERLVDKQLNSSQRAINGNDYSDNNNNSN